MLTTSNRRDLALFDPRNADPALLPGTLVRDMFDVTTLGIAVSVNADEVGVVWTRPPLMIQVVPITVKTRQLRVMWKLDPIVDDVECVFNVAAEDELLKSVSA